jgi:hypothetical protein
MHWRKAQDKAAPKICLLLGCIQALLCLKLILRNHAREGPWLIDKGQRPVSDQVVIV